MKNLFTRKRLSVVFCSIGIGLMGVDLFMTRDFFTHVAELMAASIICLLAGLALDHSWRRSRLNASSAGKEGRS